MNIKRPVSEADFQALLDSAYGSALTAIWAELVDDSATWEENREVFLDVLERALNSKRLRLYKNGTQVPGTIPEQIASFREAFPKTNRPYPPSSAGMEVWLYDPACPGEAAWFLKRDGGIFDWTQV